MLNSHVDTTLHKGQLSPTWFKNKVLALMKQCFELSILCDVPICMIVDGRPYTEKMYVGPGSLYGFKKFVDLWRDKKQPLVGVRLDRESIEKILENATLDTVRKMLSEVDAKLDALSRRIVKFMSEKIRRVKNSVGWERLSTDSGFEGLNKEREAAMRELMNMIELMKEKEKGKIDGEGLCSGQKFQKIESGRKKLHSWSSTKNSIYEKIERLSLDQIKNLLYELESMIDYLSNPWLTLGCQR